MQKLKFFYLAALILISAKSLNAQGKAGGLIINEVYLDRTDPSKNWIEVHNPTNETLSLTQFAISTFLTPNLLDKATVENGGIKVEKNDYILLSADAQIKNKNQQQQNKIFVFGELKLVDKAGLINIGTKEKGNDGYDIIKYGEDIYSTLVKDVANAKLIPLSSNGKSFSRNTKGVSLSDRDFYESEPTPFEKNK